MLKKILVFLLVVLILIQFFHPAKNKSTGAALSSIAGLYPVPAEVKTILEKGCYDCHSNNTIYPWYSKIQPVDWWLADHVKDGKRALNFDEFSTYNPRRQYHKLDEISKTVKEGEMPLNSYTWIHKDAVLTDPEKQTMIHWADGIRESMKAKYPIDSLEKKENEGPRP